MASVPVSFVRRKYALAALLGLVGTGLATFGYMRWADAPFGLYDDTGAATRQADGIGSANLGTLTGIEVVDNALAALAGRSPGTRTVGISGKGKGPARAYRYTRSPAAQALEEAFSSPVGASRVIPGRRPDAAPALVLPPAIFGTEAAPGITSALAPATGAIGGGPGGGAFFPPGGFSVGGIGGGGGGGGGVPPVVVTPEIPVTPVLPAVPEPSTWLMLLLGMSMTGAALRWGKAASPRILQAVP